MQLQGRCDRRGWRTGLFLVLLLAVPALNSVFAAIRAGNTAGDSSVAVEQSGETIATALANNPAATLFTRGLQRAGRLQELHTSADLVLFVPSDEVLRQQGAAFLLDVVLSKAANSDRLDALMAQHLFPDSHTDYQPGTESQPEVLSNEQGRCIKLERTGTGQIKVGPEAITLGKQSLVNGQIYWVDRLLWNPQDHDSGCE